MKYSHILPFWSSPNRLPRHITRLHLERTVPQLKVLYKTGFSRFRFCTLILGTIRHMHIMFSFYYHINHFFTSENKYYIDFRLVTLTRSPEISQQQAKKLSFKEIQQCVFELLQCKNKT